MLNCWIVTEDGLRGTENQCRGVAEALGITPVLKRIRLKQPWKMLSPWIGLEHAGIFSGDSLEPPWPDLLLASGRKSVAASRYIKKASRGKTFTVQIQDPRIAPHHFDLVAVPEHDPARGRNVIVTTAAPNRITPEKLKEARKDFQTLLSALPSPRVAVLIGGTSKAHKMTTATAQTLADELQKLAKDYALMITASRRTDPENRTIIETALKETNALFWDGTGENPYFGFLAWADFIIVTADSVSMISEAASTGKPVYIVPMAGGTARFDRFHKRLLKKGIIRHFEGKLEPYNYQPLHDAAFIAAEIRNLLKTP